MSKALKLRRWGSLLLAAVLVVPAFGAAGAANAEPVSDPEPVLSEPQDYFQTRYSALAGKEHVFDTLTYHELDYLLRKEEGTYIVLFGGSWQPEVQAAIGHINEVAQEYGITSIRNFDPKLDGPNGWIDITDSSPTVTTTVFSTDVANRNPLPTGAGTTDFSVRYVDLVKRYLTNLNEVTAGSAGTLQFTYNGESEPTVANKYVAPFLFIYNKDHQDENDQAAPIIASLEGISELQNGEAAYKNALRDVFDAISPVGTKNAQYDVFTNQTYIPGSYNEFSNTGDTATPIFEESDKPVVIDSVTKDELDFLLETDATHAIVIGCAWCGNTQAIIKYVNQIAKEYGITTVYNWDTKLDGGLDNTPGRLFKHGGGDYLQTRAANKYISTVYVDWVNKYLPNLSEHVQYFPTNGKHNNDIVYDYQDEETGDFITARASRLQAPYVFVYDKRNYNEANEWKPILGHVELMYSWSNTKNPTHNHSLLYKEGLRTLYSRIEWKPTGLTTAPPATPGGSNGKIIGIEKKKLEYRLKGETNYTEAPSTGNEITGLAAGVYEVRYAAKTGVDTQASQRKSLYDPGPAIEVLVLAYPEAPANLRGISPTGDGLTDGLIVARTHEGSVVDLPEGLEYKQAGQDESAYADVTGTAITGLAAGTYHIRYKATANSIAGAAAEINVPGYNQLESPSELAVTHPTSLDNNDGEITGLTEGSEYHSELTIEFKKGGEDQYTAVSDEAIAAGRITGLTPDVYSVRYAVYENLAASEPVQLVIKAYVAAPTGLEGVPTTSAEQNDGQIEITGTSTGLEYRKDGAGGYTPLSNEAVANNRITGLSPGLYYVRYAETSSAQASQATAVIVKAFSSAPAGLSGVAPTSAGGADGKITGVSTGHEYRAEGSDTYVQATGSEITSLSAGDYYVRYAETATTLASAEVKVTVPAYVAPSGGGGGGGNTNDTTPAGVSDSPNGGTVTVEAKVDEESGAAIALVTPNAAKALLSKAKQAESDGKKPVVEIKVEDVGQTGNVQVTVPRTAFDELVSGTSADVVIDVGFGKIVFDATALREIGGSTDDGDISFILIKSELTPEGKEVLGDRPVYDLLVYAGQTGVTSFGGSAVQVSLPYTLQPGEDPDAVIVYYVTDEGELQVVRGKYHAETKSVDFATTHFSQYIIGYNKIEFTDVAQTAWYAKAVSYLAAREITSGTDDEHFSPNATIRRGEFIVLLLNAFGIAPEAAGASNFSDAGNTYYTGYLAAAKRLGIANGFEGNRFSPNATITRQDLFTLLYRALKAIGELPASQGAASTSAFTDAAAIPSYAQEAFDALVGAGIITGSGGKLNPSQSTSRAEVAQVLYRLLSQ